MYLTNTLIVVALLRLANICSSQFVAHFNDRLGLVRGNVTFDVRQDDSGDSSRKEFAILEIEALLESNVPQEHSDGAEWREVKLESNSSSIFFEWQLYSLSAETPAQLQKCSDLGHEASEPLLKSLPMDQRLIQANVLNRWSLSLNRTKRELMSHIWAKSMRLKLARLHAIKAGSGAGVTQAEDKEEASPAASKDADEPEAGLERPRVLAGAKVAKSPLGSARPLINKPHLLSGPKPAASNTSASAGLKPTNKFAPRPKSSLQSRLNNSAISTTRRPSPTRPSFIRQRRQANAAGLAAAAAAAAAAAGAGATNSSLRAQAHHQVEAAHHKRVVESFGQLLACANLIDTRQVKSSEANFDSGLIGGSIGVRSSEDELSLISVRLYHLRSKLTTRHDWKLMASDILDSRQETEKCKYLQLVYDPNNVEGSPACQPKGTGQDSRPLGLNCSRVGDFGKRHGSVQVTGVGKAAARSQFADVELAALALESSRPLFVVIFESSQLGPRQPKGPSILSCAQLLPLRARRLEARFSMDGVRGLVSFEQRHRSEPVKFSYDLYGLEGNVHHLEIRELPVFARWLGEHEQLGARDQAQPPDSACSRLGRVYPSELGGNLSARFGPLQVIDSDYEDHYAGEQLDLQLALFGAQTIAGRSVLLAKNSGALAWVCATLSLVAPSEAEAAEFALITAEARFHFPAVGRISFVQLAGEPHSPTQVQLELYKPNGEQEAQLDQLVGLDWRLHSNEAGRDFYNWSARCESAGDVFDPLAVAQPFSSSAQLLGSQAQPPPASPAGGPASEPAYLKQCSASRASDEMLRCRVGDLSLKSQLRLRLSRWAHEKLRAFYSDPYLPLQGPNSILARSLVLYDDKAPEQRGKRLACATIKRVHPVRASVSLWQSGPSIASNVRGVAKFYQIDPYDKWRTKLELDLRGLNAQVNDYAIHQVWLTDEREFPCSNDSLYDIYDSLAGRRHTSAPSESNGAAAAYYGYSPTHDRLRAGELSKKHGSLDNLQSFKRHLLDFNLPLASQAATILGRSIVLRAAVNDFRWVCGNIELDYERSSEREIVALASFDDARSQVAGYVRLRQLEYADGSLSDTFLQLDLKLRSSGGGGGGESLQNSPDHQWAVFVNQVGEDAYISADEVRCIAAGFKWNPYLARDTLEAYSSSWCTRSESDACAMGDLGQRHGPLTLGPDGRRALSDSNLPLAGNYSIMGRSLVIFDSKRAGVKLACANIQPDQHLKSNLVIRHVPSFTMASFIEQMRGLLGAAEWLMVPELRSTKLVAEGECVQMTIHFYGPRAHQIQSELNNLITMGTVHRSTRGGLEKISTHYRAC